MSQLPSDFAQQVTTALTEDIGGGDITAQLVPAAQRVTGQVITREAATLCGRPWVTEVFRQLDPAVQLTWHADDGDRITANQTLFEIMEAIGAMIARYPDAERAGISLRRSAPRSSASGRPAPRFPNSYNVTVP